MKAGFYLLLPMLLFLALELKANNCIDDCDQRLVRENQRAENWYHKMSPKCEAQEGNPEGHTKCLNDLEQIFQKMKARAQMYHDLCVGTCANVD